MNQRSDHLYEFGPFRLDVAERLLLRDGESVSLTPKAFDLLLALIVRHGRLQEKDELLKLVWPDTFVEEANLSYNISLIRRALADGEDGHRYIETVPKRGYRFVAGVREVKPEIEEVAEPAQAVSGDERGAIATASKGESLVSGHTRRKRFAALALVALLIVLGGIGFWLYSFPMRSSSLGGGSTSASKIVPVTSFLGSESHPAFSPDGNQLAFVWDGVKEDNPDIYVKFIDTGEPLRLTTNPAPDLHPVWSPDGRHIAFTREGEESGIYLVPALGGAERKLADIFPERPSNKLSLSYSPDGKYLAVADKTATMEPYSIFLLATETGEKRRLTFPPAGPIGDDSPAFSPDRRSLAFIRSHSLGVRDIYVVPLAGGEPARLTSGNAKTGGVSWTADGRELVFSAIRGGFIQHLWRAPLTGGAPERLPMLTQNLSHPAISRQGNRLAWAQSIDDQNIWRVEINPATGQAEPPAKLIASSLGDVAPQFSPDGQKIAFGSVRTGRAEIWVSDHNGANPITIASLGKVSGTPRWSPDGRQIVFDSLVEDNWDIYVVGANGGQPRRLTTDPADDTCGSWSRDGRWIYFGSGRSGSLQIWKMPVAGGQAVQVTRDGGFEGFESPDGKYFYYAKGRQAAGIWRIPVEGGEETLVLDHHRAGYWRYWAVTEQGIYFATAEVPAHPLLEFFSFATGKVTLVATIEKQIQAGTWGLAVSPDARWILYTQFDQRGSDIMLMENFR